MPYEPKPQRNAHVNLPHKQVCARVKWHRIRMKNTEFAIIWFHPSIYSKRHCDAAFVMYSRERAVYLCNICIYTRTRSRLSMTSMERIWNAHSAHQFVNVHNKKSRIDFLHFFIYFLFYAICTTLCFGWHLAAARMLQDLPIFSCVRLKCLTESYIRGIRAWFCRHDYYFSFRLPFCCGCSEPALLITVLVL